MYLGQEPILGATAGLADRIRVSAIEQAVAGYLRDRGRARPSELAAVISFWPNLVVPELRRWYVLTEAGAVHASRVLAAVAPREALSRHGPAPATLGSGAVGPR